ncbi:chromosome partitioning protein ParA [Photobacterium sp. TY1-4]|uniref:chromosome partitioning protein ParA n=1 Tax=Photobacterium sp. TY1-4 TaxID=2899122 RepID=UPI0021BFB591|nr:chromosome partitioning protein ParA [Photobacterium sp. TY1-4]UXI01346.1 chromosome partitioning protein ParA [Photobacterium sp. TY1-4]
MAVILSLIPLTTQAQQPKTGYFIDAPVTGLYYKTSSDLSGTTQKGAFQYHPGDVISFFLGKDDNSYLLTTLSGREVITPTASTTQPSRSINMTRLLLSLDETPQNREEILLMSQALSSPEFQQQLQGLDLSFLDNSAGKLALDLVSVEEAVTHLNQSQRYIEQNFRSNEVIYAPLHVRLANIIIKKKDGQGRVCALDARRAHDPNYNPPIGEVTYEITTDKLIQYPSVGDYFHGCDLDRHGSNHSQIEEPLSNFADWDGLIGCAATGCTRNDLNGFSLDNHDDEGDWKYRTLALNFDPQTQLLMEKVQGLGRHEKVHHANKTEMIWFTYPRDKGHRIAHEGIWRQTSYQGTAIRQSCLLIEAGRVFSGPDNVDQCPETKAAYPQDVTQHYADMWWLQNPNRQAQLAQLNVLVRWYQQDAQPQYTTWEYLPAGQFWDQGVLYRYRQIVTPQPDGSDRIDTFAISEFIKVSGVRS